MERLVSTCNSSENSVILRIKYKLSGGIAYEKCMLISSWGTNWHNTAMMLQGHHSEPYGAAFICVLHRSVQLCCTTPDYPYTPLNSHPIRGCPCSMPLLIATSDPCASWLGQRGRIPAPGPDCSGFPDLIFLPAYSCSHLSDQASACLRTFTTVFCLLSGFSFTSSAYHLFICTPCCHPFGMLLVVIFCRGRSLPQTPRKDEHLLLCSFLYLGCSGYWTDTATETVSQCCASASLG